MQLWREKKLTSCHKLGSDVVPIQPGWPEHHRAEQLELLRCREHQLRSACNAAADITNFERSTTAIYAKVRQLVSQPIFIAASTLDPLSWISLNSLKWYRLIVTCT